MKPGTNLNVNLAEQSIRYFAIDTSNASNPQIVEVDTTSAQKILKQLKHQAHTISHINNATCLGN